MTATWPAAPFPQVPRRDGFQRGVKSAVISFGTEVGPGKRRRRSAARTIPCTAKFTILQTDVPTFETFFQTTLADGTLPFTWTDPVRGDAATWLFDANEPYACVPMIGILWELTVKIERQP